MRFASIAEHRSVWQAAWLCGALDASRAGSVILAGVALEGSRQRLAFGAH